MKRLLFFFAAVAIAAAAAWGAKENAAASFSLTSVDLGRIDATKGPVTFEYPFTNTGTRPLVIVSVSNGGCGCTRPSFPKEPIAPGKSGKISITFNPEGRSGELNRQVTVRTNGKPKTVKLRFSGVVVPPARR